ncbi:hypothetical protein CLAFUW4_06826 [Fulvia fulva]|uniref:Uncharacterized protein n=1 Tax=Passalora fulva TaxID=5499 RepID=A0A9Q8UQK5_PASFU|nr:uncharacterized protein CLAFUR5_06962 [Fulvia fulva]KAK4621734.1 hypothetical protein CLAFUR4_06834 [Fulvia fulva]KAK4622825.1 hypothetical protein CLAFUR0_06829 [Fulvia fulva]UJO18790.1 hypothetical protein CLAFUR5_06962 [Fulvia fulva]WPV16580.1 hypothetical protein CLAFUW4_06826 [Fulvia fulva]WPV30749.1 hypothetical protein CLAFUW7_06825 [Fulvia fulva]
MKQSTSILLLPIFLAFLAQAKPSTFHYDGVIEDKGDGIKCSGSITYTVTDDAGGADQTGHFTVDDCPGGQVTLSDGIWTLSLDRDARTSSIQTVSNDPAATINGGEGEYVGVQTAYHQVTCPPATKMTCFFGAGPGNTAPTTTDCGLT